VQKMIFIVRLHDLLISAAFCYLFQKQDSEFIICITKQVKCPYCSAYGFHYTGATISARKEKEVSGLYSFMKNKLNKSHSLNRQHMKLSTLHLSFQ